MNLEDRNNSKKPIQFTTEKELAKHLDELKFKDYKNLLFDEDPEYINYFEQVMNEYEWKADLSKTEQQYLSAFEHVLRENNDLYSVIRIPLHEEIPYVDREAVKAMLKENPSLSEKKIAEAVSAYSPYTIVYSDKEYGKSIVKDMTKTNSR